MKIVLLCLIAAFSIGGLMGFAVSTASAAKKAEPQLGHMVFFTLKDRTPAAAAKLVAACDKYLSGHEGALYYSAGTRVDDLKREVNDLDFDVALHVVFDSRSAHDSYQEAPRHLKFIEENKADWAKVRVFDSYIQPTK
jgi:Stress responsive A/B Barrel Domain